MTTLSRDYLLQTAVLYFNGIIGDVKWSKSTRENAMRLKARALKEMGAVAAEEYRRTYGEGA